MRPDELKDVLGWIRANHPSLERPATLAVLRNVANADGVPVVFGVLPRDGVMMAALGTAVIVLRPNLSIRRRTEVLAHELAHVWLHADQRHELLDELRKGRTLSPAERSVVIAWREVQEREAEALTSALLAGSTLLEQNHYGLQSARAA
jgi:hypothetical protein